MKDKYIMDGHKLIWHLDRVTAWLRGERIAPLHIDVGLSKGCNIRCHYCFGVLQGNMTKRGTNIYFQREPLLRYMRDAGEAGVRSMALIGESEPLLNPNVYDAIIVGKKAGVDISMGTNGILYDTGAKGQEALEYLSWIRFNISAASKESYKKMHASAEFDTLMEKVKFCISEKKKRNLPVTIGFQMVLTPKDVGEAVPLAKLGKQLGIDYFEIKHCGDTVENALGIYNKLDTYAQYKETLLEAENESTDDYRVIVKWGNILNKGVRNYDQCFGIPFLLYSSGDGMLYPCGMFFDFRSDEFRLGNLNEQSFKEIIESDRYWDIIAKIRDTMDVHKQCYAHCRTHAINDFLWKLKNPPPHVNFV